MTITVTDVDEAPEIMVGPATGLTVSGPASESYAENGTGPVATYTASGPDAASATWTLGGDDAGDFNISQAACSRSLACRTTRTRRTPTLTTCTW